MRTSSQSTASAVSGAIDVVGEFRPRASSLAVSALHAHGCTDAELRVGRALATFATFANAGHLRRWKTRPGEVFTMAGVDTIAAAAGCSLQHVYNTFASMKAAGVIQRRQCSRTRWATVFVIPAIRQPEWKPDRQPESRRDSKPDQVPRCDPRGEGGGTPRPVKRTDPDRPSVGEARYLARLLCERDGLRPADAEQFIATVLKGASAYRVAERIGYLRRMPREEVLPRRWKNPDARAVTRKEEPRFIHLTCKGGHAFCAFKRPAACRCGAEWVESRAS